MSRRLIVVGLEMAAVVPAGGDAELPRFFGGQWVACAIDSSPRTSWVPDDSDRGA